MCHEYWYEQKLKDEAEERARQEAEKLIQKAKEAKPKTPATSRPEIEKLLA
ncbi:MAG: hypothetical protein HY083_03310 [Gammaproteobacteria bacterium]|nr:hypothetical protein [Gammaproteobacteria bacterium]